MLLLQFWSVWSFCSFCSPALLASVMSMGIFWPKRSPVLREGSRELHQAGGDGGGGVSPDYGGVLTRWHPAGASPCIKHHTGSVPLLAARNFMPGPLFSRGPQIGHRYVLKANKAFLERTILKRWTLLCMVWSIVFHIFRIYITISILRIIANKQSPLAVVCNQWRLEATYWQVSLF